MGAKIVKVFWYKTTGNNKWVKVEEFKKIIYLDIIRSDERRTFVSLK